MDKRSTRETVLRLRAALTPEERAIKSQKILYSVMNLPEFRQATTIMSFLNFGEEVETTQIAQTILDSGKTLVLPRCAPRRVLIPAIVHDLVRDVEPGTWGIREPKKEGLVEIDPLAIDFLIMPGAAFDLKGNRLGYGGGFYDRFLTRIRPDVPKIALAFQCQVLPEVPVEPYDQKIDGLVTEEGVFRF